MNRTGQTIDARYRVERRIGTGGMADVFACEDLQLGRHVALKVLHEQLAEDPQVVARFRRESQSAAGLQHPHIVQVFDRGDWDGIPYMAMELVDGVTLKDVIRDQAPLDPVKTIDQISQVLDALRYAHRRGLVHRDIKPQNVLVGQDGDLKVADFGIARAVDDLQMTQTGMIVGTAHYLSPEQASGQNITPAADLYAVGVVLFEMLTGRLPFDGDQPVAIALKHVNEEPPALSIVNPEVPADLEAVVMRALSKAPDDRFADAEEFIAALQGVRHRIVSGAPAPERGTYSTGAPGYGDQPTGGWLQPAAGMAVPAGVAPEEAREQAEARQRRRRAWTITVALATLVALALVGYLIFGRMETVPNVIGISQGKAVQKLEEQGFRVTVEQALNERRAGQVFRQDPRPRKRVRHGSRILLTVSSGPKQLTVPAVASLSARDARAALVRAGFGDGDITQQQVASESIPAGRAIGTDPGVGLKVDPGSPIVLSVSSGPPSDKNQVEVPDLVGKSRADAEAALKEAGFQVDVTESETDAADPGTVTAQSPSAKALATKGSVVRLTVAKKPATDEPNPPPSNDVNVPNVERQARAAADKALKDAGLKPRYTTVSVDDESLDGKVVNQFPKDRKVPKGSTIDLQVGKFQPTTTTNPNDGAGAKSDGDGARAPVADGAGGRTTPAVRRARPGGARQSMTSGIRSVIAWPTRPDDGAKRT
ncbi:Stk1 family PASTA domain-containing Ser/Thr kinase [Patulibacter defluvii]|uniref:Stk1 family PASTA domain-containing Ser/Thr kinase n=1 Tax=Patulibacter defluvii TaxID=3095358 RepID=UPI002A74D977|nr:Stk1 family PASTA domain-containing Ser/Thr kinase [Patulibacter sp. DM4]